MANCRILRHVTKQALLQSLCRRPWWVTSCSISCKDDHGQTKHRRVRPKESRRRDPDTTLLTRPVGHLSPLSTLAVTVPHPVGDLADATEGSLGLLLRRFLLGRPFGLPARPSLGLFVGNRVDLFLLVSEDGQAELAAEVHEGAVLCWNRDHVPGLKNLPAHTKKCDKEWAAEHNVFPQTHHRLRSPNAKRKKNSIKQILGCCRQDADVCRGTVPVALETGSALVGWRQMASQTDCGAEELRRTFSLECCLAFEQNLQPIRKPWVKKRDATFCRISSLVTWIRSQISHINTQSGTE